MTGLWWHEASKLLFVACWTEPAFDTKRSWSQHLSPDELDIFSTRFSLCCSSLHSAVCSLHRSRWMQQKHNQGSVNFELCDVDKADHLEMQNNNNKKRLLWHTTNGFQWQLEIIKQTCTVCSVLFLSTKLVYISKHWQLEQTHCWCWNNMQAIGWKSGQQAILYHIPVMCWSIFR